MKDYWLVLQAGHVLEPGWANHNARLGFRVSRAIEDSGSPFTAINIFPLSVSFNSTGRPLFASAGLSRSWEHAGPLSWQRHRPPT